VESFFVVVAAAVMLGTGLWAWAAVQQFRAAVDLGSEAD
jgi:hypothetical protein